MKNRFLLAGGTLSFLATALLLQPSSIAGVQAPAQGATISGTVTRAGTSEPIPDVNVLITNSRVGPRGQIQAQSLEQQVNAAIAQGRTIPPNIQAQLDAERARGGMSNIQLTTKSDRDGRFIVRDLPPGQYTVQVEREGFFGPPLLGSGNFPTFVNTNIIITAGQATPNLSLSLIPGSAVSGRVVDPEGRPVVGSNVQAFRLSYQNGAATLQAVAAADTDDRGDYRLFRIPPGEYYIGVTPGQSGARGFGARAGRGAIATTGEALVRTFHPDAIDTNGARLFTLQAGQELTGIAITARRSPTIKISGQVSSSIALPVQTNARGLTRTMPVQLFLIPRSKNTAEEPNNRTTLSVSLDSPTDGKFEIPNVIPGAYDLYARVNNSTADPATITAETPTVYFGRTSFEAGRQDVSGLAVHVRPGVEVKTYVTVDGSAAAAANAVRISLQADDGPRSLPGYVGRGGQFQAGADGIITFPFVNDGIYRFQAAIVATNVAARGQRGAGQPLRDAYVEDIREGGLSVYDNGLVVGKEPPRQVEVVIKTNGGTVMGTVYDAQLQPAAGATVALVPPEARRQNIALYKFATSGADGQFAMIAIPPGQYKVLAWESIPTGAYQNAAFIAKYEARGTAITVNAASTTNSQVTVIPADR
jgi:hypothetical protein